MNAGGEMRNAPLRGTAAFLLCVSIATSSVLIGQHWWASRHGQPVELVRCGLFKNGEFILALRADR
jgi:hypothetical protein